MQVAVWGPVGWKFLHSVAHGYPEIPEEFDEEHNLPKGTTAANYTSFFNSLGNVLPCKYCRDSYMKFIKESPIRTESRYSITKWLWEIHNKVNNKLGANSSDFNSVCAEYESYRASCSKKSAMGCTVPYMNNTKKKSVVTVYEVNRNPFAKFFITILIFISAYLLFKKFNRRSS